MKISVSESKLLEHKNLKKQYLFHIVSLEHVRNFDYLGYITGYWGGGDNSSVELYTRITRETPKAAYINWIR
jgi:hypothetical protein